jgi:hypothetical protein
MDGCKPVNLSFTGSDQTTGALALPSVQTSPESAFQRGIEIIHKAIWHALSLPKAE